MRPRSRHKVEAIPAVTPPALFIVREDGARGALPKPARGQRVRDWLETWRPKAAAKGAA